MLCVQVVGGAVVPVDPQPADLTTCTLVIPGPLEVASSPFVMSLEDGAAIGVAIFVVWAIAYGFRIIGRSLD